MKNGYIICDEAVCREERKMYTALLAMRGEEKELTDAEKENCVDKLCEIIDAIDTPIILMGDFNMVPDYPALKKIRERLVDTAPLLNNGEFDTFGSYVGANRQHIDYIFVSKEIKPLSLNVIETKVSDHFPVIMECEI